MEVTIKRFDEGVLDSAVLMSPLGSYKSSSAYYSLAVGGIVRESNGFFSVIPAPTGYLGGWSAAAATSDSLYALGITDASETFLLRWSGASWEQLAELPAFPVDEYQTPIFTTHYPITSVGSVVYLVRHLRTTGSLSAPPGDDVPPTYHLQVYRWDGSLSLVDEVSGEYKPRGEATDAASLYEKDGRLYLSLLYIWESKDDSSATSGVKCWTSEGGAFSPAYEWEEDNETEGVSTLSFSIRPIDGTDLWEASFPYNRGGENQKKLYINFGTQTEREAVSNEKDIVYGAQVGSFWIGGGDSDGVSGLWWRDNWGGVWAPIEGASSTPEGPFAYTTDTPVGPVPATLDGLLYAGGFRVDEGIVSFWNFELTVSGGSGDEGGDRAPILRAGPVSRVVNEGSRVLEAELSLLRDISPASTEGSLILDANGYHVLGLAASEEPSAIKLRTE